MAACSQWEVNRVVERCRAAAAKYGGQSDELSEVRKYYQMFHDCPEHGALVALEHELEQVGF